MPKKDSDMKPAPDFQEKYGGGKGRETVRDNQGNVIRESITYPSTTSKTGGNDAIDKNTKDGTHTTIHPDGTVHKDRPNKK